MKKSLIIGGFVVLFIFGFAIFNSQKQNNPNTTKSLESTIEKSSSPTVISVSPSVAITQGSVPLPQETDIVRTFFLLIEERKISDAVGMMIDSITTDDSRKQAWGVQLNAIKSVKVLDVVPSIPEEWMENKHTYKVILDVVMDPSSATAPIPYYGYERGKNIRWITLEKSGNTWKIIGIATGP
ncbi:MAG: hypothetical protein V1922_05135 [bacterium]